MMLPPQPLIEETGLHRTAAYTLNGESISSAAFYAVACDPSRNVAVEACAGAGKTWMLVSRMLRALLDGQTQAHEILAITFTKKAAGEMRERLYDWLARFANADPATLEKELVQRGVDIKSTGKPNKDVRGQLSNLYSQILSQGRPVQIRTFHSWFAALLRSAPMAALEQLGLPLNYELLEDDSPAKALVWRRFYAALVLQPTLKADFEAVVQAYGRSQASKALQGALDKRTEFLLADANDVVTSSVQRFGVQFPEFAGLAEPGDAFFEPSTQELFTNAAKALGRASAVTFAAKGAELKTALFERDTVNILSALLTLEGQHRKFGDKIVGVAIIRQAQQLAGRVAAAQAQHDAWDYQQRMARLARLLLAEFAALKRERGWVDMNDVERAAQFMLSDPVLSGWVQQRLDARIRHLMIDEFQDTNPLQWQALSSWLSGYAGAGGGGGQPPSVFIVGDPKQSIYRFRRAEPQVFIAAQAFVRDALGGDVLACDHTRRSSLAVVTAVNSVMGAAGAAAAYAGFRPHTTASTEVGRVIRLPLILRAEKSKSNPSNPPTPPSQASAWRDSLTTPREVAEESLRSLEARQAAAWIQAQIASGIKPADLMVLSRKRAGLQPLEAQLRALHIPAQIGEKTDLMDCCEVLDIIALLDVLVSPQHDLSLARALRSPLFSLPDDALVQIALAKRHPSQSWFDVLQNQERLAADLSGLGAVLNGFKVLADTLPPHDALQAIYDRGDVLARFAAAAPPVNCAAVLANLQALLSAALDVDGGRNATPYAFVRAVKAGGLQAPASVNPDAVRLLTIHGAKGLEAHSVLLLDTDTAPRSRESMGVLIDWPGEAPAPQKFVFLSSESAPPACAATTLAQEQAARQREEFNALYVATTRAKNTLVVSATEAHRGAPDSWWQQLLGVATEVNVPTAAASMAADAQAEQSHQLQRSQPASESATFTLPVLPELAGFACKARPEPPIPATVESVSARIGQAMHRLLEFDDLSDTAMKRAAREFALSGDQAVQAQAMAQRIRHGDGAWAWDDPALEWQGNEVELIYGGETLRLDRLVQLGAKNGAELGDARLGDANLSDARSAERGGWWVLDYKSASSPQHQPNLVAKLQTYKAALQAIYPHLLVHAAFLTAVGTVVIVT